MVYPSCGRPTAKVNKVVFTRRAQVEIIAVRPSGKRKSQSLITENTRLSWKFTSGKITTTAPLKQPKHCGAR